MDAMLDAVDHHPATATPHEVKAVRTLVTAFIWFELAVAGAAILIMLMFAIDFGRRTAGGGASWLTVGLVAALGAVVGLLVCGVAGWLLGWLYRAFRDVVMRIAAARLRVVVEQYFAKYQGADSTRTSVRWNNPWPGAATLTMRHGVLAIVNAWTRYRTLEIPLSRVVGINVRAAHELRTETNHSGGLFIAAGGRGLLGWSLGSRSKSRTVAMERATLEVQYERSDGGVPETVFVHFGQNGPAAAAWLTAIRSYRSP